VIFQRIPGNLILLRRLMKIYLSSLAAKEFVAPMWLFKSDASSGFKETMKIINLYLQEVT
jgi:hypothetical protein